MTAKTESSPLSLDPSRLVALRVIECWISYQDYRDEKKPPRIYVKRLILEDHTRRFGEWLCAEQAEGSLGALLAKLPGDLNERIGSEPSPAEWRTIIARDEFRDPLLHAVDSRHEALQLAIHLATFRPWALADLKEKKSLRTKTMRAALTDLGGHLSEKDIEEVQEKVHEFAKELLAPTAAIKWGKRAAVASGTAVGAVAGTAMAPGVGSAIGAKMGLSGAAATNAGLAWLGGGALSAGGYGMAGGTLLIQAVSAVGGTGLLIGGTTLEGGLRGLDSSSLAEELAQTLAILKYPVLQESLGGDQARTRAAKREVIKGLGRLRDEIRGEAEALGKSASDTQLVRNRRVVEHALDIARHMVEEDHG